MKDKGWAALAALFFILTGIASAAYQITLDPAAPTVNNPLTVVVLNNGTPEQGILVQFILNGGTPILATTDTQGKAKFIPSNPGTLIIRASTIDGVPLASTQVSVTGGGATPAPGSGSTGGGGGGGIIAAEPFSNIEKSEQHDKDLVVNTAVTYMFTLPELGIYEIVVTNKVNEYGISMKVEALKGASKLAATPAPGTVYKNVNIWGGTRQIKDVLVRFKVENAWISSNSFAGSDVKLVKYDGIRWIELETSEKKKDSTHTYFEAGTDGLSLFAITGLKAPVSTAPPAAAATIPPMKEETTATSTPAGSVPGFEAIIAVAAFLACYIFWQKRR